MLGAVARPSRPSAPPESPGDRHHPLPPCPPLCKDAVASLFDQTHQNFEVLIVNDGSFESTDSVLSELERDLGVRVVTAAERRRERRPQPRDRAAQGEYLAMLDADDVFEPEFISRALETLRREPELAYVTSWLRFSAPTAPNYRKAVDTPAGKPCAAR